MTFIMTLFLLVTFIATTICAAEIKLVHYKSQAFYKYLQQLQSYNLFLNKKQELSLYLPSLKNSSLYYLKISSNRVCHMNVTILNQRNQIRFFRTNFSSGFLKIQKDDSESLVIRMKNTQHRLQCFAKAILYCQECHNNQTKNSVLQYELLQDIQSFREIFQESQSFDSSRAEAKAFLRQMKSLSSLQRFELVLVFLVMLAQLIFLYQKMAQKPAAF